MEFLNLLCVLPMLPLFSVIDEIVENIFIFVWTWPLHFLSQLFFEDFFRLVRKACPERPNYCEDENIFQFVSIRQVLHINHCVKYFGELDDNIKICPR